MNTRGQEAAVNKNLTPLEEAARAHGAAWSARFDGLGDTWDDLDPDTQAAETADMRAAFTAALDACDWTAEDGVLGTVHARKCFCDDGVPWAAIVGAILSDVECTELRETVAGAIRTRLLGEPAS